MYEAILNELLDEITENLYEASNQLLEDVKQIVPVQTGELKASGKVVKQQEGIAVVFDAPHALLVHENPNGRGYKFLERTVNDNLSKYHKIIGGGD